MKRISYINILLGLAVLSGCAKKLDQLSPSDTSVSNYFTSTNDFLQSVNGAYYRLRAIPTQLMWMNEVRSDDLAVTSDGNRDWQGINDFSPNLTTTSFIVSAWGNDFNGIFNANTTLDAIASKGAGILSDSLTKRFTGECRFLRAFYYFDLLRYYGKLPITDKAKSVDEISTVPRSSVADVYNFIISDLQYAANNLPESYPAADLGRATKYAAKGLLGLVYLTKSGPTYGIDGGTGLDSKEYDKALAQFNDIIASGKYSFLSDYASIFAYNNEDNKEVLFDIQFMSANGATNANGGEFPSQLVPDAYWNGLGYTNTYNNGYGTATYNVSKNLLQSYRASGNNTVTDKRDTFNIKHGFALSTSTPNVLDTTRPFIKKYINFALRGKDRADWPINFIVMRYTDILLMKAECILHGAAGTQADVDNIVNQVRARAGVPAYSNVDLPTLMEERRREFLGEGIRWFDLVREGMAVTTMNAWRVSDTLTSSINEVKPQYTIYPIPQAEILAKPGLYTQNDGYY
jgi:hypothetical protein